MNARTKKTREELGNKIKKCREAKYYSQEELAEVIEISRTHMGHIEQGRRSPSLEVLDKIARALKIKASELIPF